MSAAFSSTFGITKNNKLSCPSSWGDGLIRAFVRPLKLGIWSSKVDQLLGTVLLHPRPSFQLVLLNEVTGSVAAYTHSADCVAASSMINGWGPWCPRQPTSN